MKFIWCVILFVIIYLGIWVLFYTAMVAHSYMTERRESDRVVTGDMRRDCIYMRPFVLIGTITILAGKWVEKVAKYIDKFIDKNIK